MSLISSTKKLNEVCKILKKQKVITIDCEFIREKSYYPLPCLIQVGYEKEAVLIDPLSKEIDLKEFFTILQNKKILKVFHSGRQDIEILYHLSGKIPTPIFDTQIAAQVCGLGESISYENLVKIYCGVELDKSCRLTNWQVRPLTDEQIEYAKGDVVHLIECYNKISIFIEDNNRKTWIEDELKDLADISHYEVDVDKVWMKIKHNIHTAPFLNTLKALAKWRELRAIKSNTARQSIIKDDLLINIATTFPQNLNELNQVRGMRSDIAKGVLAKEILEILNNISDERFDKSICKLDRENDINLTPSQQSLYEILKLLLKIKSNEHKVVAHLITSERNLREYIKNTKNKNSILNGWRYDVFGKVAEEFRKGKLCITYDVNKRQIQVKEL